MLGLIGILALRPRGSIVCNCGCHCRMYLGNASALGKRCCKYVVRFRTSFFGRFFWREPRERTLFFVYKEIA